MSKFFGIFRSDDLPAALNLVKESEESLVDSGMPNANLSDHWFKSTVSFGEGTLAGQSDVNCADRHASHGDHLAFRLWCTATDRWCWPFAVAF